MGNKIANKNLFDGMFWDREAETLPRDDLEKLQVQRLKKTLEKLKAVPFYKDKIASLHIEKIKSVDDIQRLPFTTKNDLRNHYPYRLLAVPLESCVRVHTSSGTTGSAVAVLHTENDIDNWSNLVARCMYGVGVKKHDIFQNMAGYGLFTGGLGFHYGAQKLGTLTIPASAGNSRRQVRLIADFGTTVVHIMPSFALYLMRIFEDLGIDPKIDTKLRTFFLGAEPHSEATRKRIEAFYGVDAYNSYGLSEMNGPGVSFECHLKDGLHIWEDNYLVEIIDPDGDEPLPVGETGELTYTTLTREAMPLLRYRSGDLGYFIPEPCACGRTHRRVSRIQGRKDDMIIWKGVNIFPNQIEKIVMENPEVSENFLVTLETKGVTDTMTIQVETRNEFLESERSEELRKKIALSFQSELLVNPQVVLVPIGTLPVTESKKAKRIIDKRSL